MKTKSKLGLVLCFLFVFAFIGACTSLDGGSDLLPNTDNNESSDDEEGDGTTLPTSLSFTSATATLNIGLDRQFTVSVLPSGASSLVTWSVDATDNATVDEDGVLTGVSTGSVTVKFGCLLVEMLRLS